MNRVYIAKQAVVFFKCLVLASLLVTSVQWLATNASNWTFSHKGFFTASLPAPIENVSANIQKPLPSDSPAVKPLANPDTKPTRNWQVEDLALDAPSAIAVEIGNQPSKILFQKNAQIRLPVASLTKLMTALAVMQNLDLGKKITIDSAAMAQEGEQGSLQLGQTLSVKNLLYITLMESSNRAAFALSEVMGTDAFVSAMNEQAKNLGLTQTHFSDPAGLDVASHSSAKDLAVLSGYLFENYPLFREIVSQKEHSLYLDDGTLHHVLVNTNKLLGTDNIIGGKTGWTDKALGCFMVVQQNQKQGDDIIYIVLGTEDRFGQMQELVDWVGKAYTW